MCVIGWFQMLGGFFRANKDASWRRPWEVFHKLTGRVLVILGFLVILSGECDQWLWGSLDAFGTGMSVYESPTAVRGVFIAWIAIYAAATVFREVFARVCNRRRCQQILCEQVMKCRGHDDKIGTETYLGASSTAGSIAMDNF